MRISDWSSDLCSSDLGTDEGRSHPAALCQWSEARTVCADATCLRQSLQNRRAKDALRASMIAHRAPAGVLPGFCCGWILFSQQPEPEPIQVSLVNCKLYPRPVFHVRLVGIDPQLRRVAQFKHAQVEFQVGAVLALGDLHQKRRLDLVGEVGGRKLLPWRGV